MSGDRETRQRRHVTITFDDGLIEGAQKAVQILNTFGAKATFYVVTGWIRPRRVWRVRDRFNKHCDHGTWRDWRDIAAQGHEVGSHTVSHVNASGRAARRVPGLLRWEITRSYQHIKRHVGQTPRSISMPWNAATTRSDSYVKALYAACRLGNGTIRFTNCRHVDWYRLHSWAPTSDVPVRTFCETVASIPPNHWLILQFHSLDDEGYMPISSGVFANLLEFIVRQPDLDVRTVGEMVDLYGNRSAAV